MNSAYLSSNTSPLPDVLNDVYRSVMLHTANPGMASTPYQGQLLRMLVQWVQPSVAVEVGCQAGFGSVCIASAMPAGSTLHLLEANEEYSHWIDRHARMAGVEDKLALHIGDAAQLIPRLPDGIGFAFVDADKESYPRYYQLLLPKMAPGGLLLFDNMLWYGRVLEAPSDSSLRCDRDTRALQLLAQQITQDQRVDNILLPIRDGIMLCRKR